MVLGYDYSNQKGRRQANVPPSQAMLMTTQTHWSDTEGIARFSMSRATPEAIRRLLVPYCPGGCQGIKQQNDDAKCTRFAGHFDGHRNEAVQYQVHRLMEEVHGFHKSR